MMKTGIRLVCLLLFLGHIGVKAQNVSGSESSNTKTIVSAYQLDKSNSQFTIQGTSSLHDWEMVSEVFEGSLGGYYTSDQTLKIQTIELAVPVKSLLSGKKVMDKKCWDALKCETHPDIRYRFKSIDNLKSVGDGTYTATFAGLLTVAGETLSVIIPVVIKDKGDAFHITGEKPLKMSDFDVTPPKALLGTLKTGNEINIVFNLNYLRS